MSDNTPESRIFQAMSWSDDPKVRQAVKTVLSAGLTVIDQTGGPGKETVTGGELLELQGRLRDLDTYGWEVLALDRAEEL